MRGVSEASETSLAPLRKRGVSETLTSLGAELLVFKRGVARTLTSLAPLFAGVAFGTPVRGPGPRQSGAAPAAVP